MNTLERKNIARTSAETPKMLGQFATMAELADFKTAKANKLLAKVKNLEIIK